MELAKARSDVKELKAKMDVEQDEDEIDDMFVEWKQVSYKHTATYTLVSHGDFLL